MYHTVVFATEVPQISNARRTLVNNKIVDHSDVVGATPVQTTSSFSTALNGLDKDSYRTRR